MRLISFRAEQFRNIAHTELSLSHRVEILSGKNAQGKTNAVEGIYMFARGRSFRNASDKDLVSFGKDGFHISIEYEDKDGHQSLSYSYVNGERKRKKNGYEVRKISDFIGQFRAVLFTPDHLRLVKDSPEERRNFLNIAISQCYPSYIRLYADYKHAQEERSCLLKMAAKGMPIHRDELEAWSESLALYSADIFEYRKNYIQELRGFAKEQLRLMSGEKEELLCSYKSDIKEEGLSKEEIKNAYRRVYTENLSREMAAGVTLFGPSRDDLELSINGQSVRHFASQGQQRSCVLALKGAEAEVSRKVCGEYPVCIYDDVMSELDETRRAFLLKDVGEKQYILTGCDTSLSVYKDAHITQVEDGVYVSVDR